MRVRSAVITGAGLNLRRDAAGQVDLVIEAGLQGHGTSLEIEAFGFASLGVSTLYRRDKT